MTRVSERYRYDSTNARIGTAREIADNAQQTVLSGRKLRKVSDDPIAMGRALKNRSRIENIAQFRRTIDFGKGYLAKTEESLRGLNEVLMRAQELGIQQANGTYDKESHMAASEEVRQLAEHAVGLANTSYANRYVFGGFQTTQPPVSPEGTYMGDDGIIFVQVDEDSYRPVSFSGREIFDVPAEKIGKERSPIEGIRQLYFALRNNDTAGIQHSLTDLNEAETKISNALSVVGARQSAIDDVAQRLGLTEGHLYEDGNELESADPIKAAMDLQRANTALQSTLAAGAKILTPSLLTFLHS